MPISKCQIVLVCAIIFNCLILFYVSHVHNINGSWLRHKQDAEFKKRIDDGKLNASADSRHEFEKDVTIVFLEFEEFENDVGRTISSIFS